MSMDTCKICDRPVDTDFDLECYVPDPNHPKKWERCICESCREDQELEAQESAEPAPKCGKCGDTGYFVSIGPTCCGNVTDGGECRAFCAVPEEIQEQCDECPAALAGEERAP